MAIVGLGISTEARDEGLSSSQLRSEIVEQTAATVPSVRMADMWD